MVVKAGGIYAFPSGEMWACSRGFRAEGDEVALIAEHLSDPEAIAGQEITVAGKSCALPMRVLPHARAPPCACSPMRVLPMKRVDRVLCWLLPALPRPRRTTAGPVGRSTLARPRG